MTVTYQFQITECTSCGNKIRNGFRRFGPAKVECYYCGKILDTGLNPWFDLPKDRRNSIIFAELLAPSWNYPAITLLLTLFFGVLVGGVIVILPVVFFFRNSGFPDWLLCSLYFPSILVYIALFNGIRLSKIIQESNRFSQEGVIPIWK